MNKAFKIDSTDAERLQLVFRDLSADNQRKVMISAFKKCLKITLKQARQNINSQSGRLSKSLGVMAVRGQTAVIIGARRAYGGNHGHLLEDGTKIRTYVAKKSSIHPLKSDGWTYGFYRTKAGQTYSTGQMKKDGYYSRFLGRAIDSTQKLVYDTLKNEVLLSIDKYHKKHGLR